MEYLISLIFSFFMILLVMHFGFEKPIIESLIWAALISPVLSLISKIQADSSPDYHPQVKVDPKIEHIGTILGIMVFGSFFVGVLWYVN